MFFVPCECSLKGALRNIQITKKVGWPICEAQTALTLPIIGIDFINNVAKVLGAQEHGPVWLPWPEPVLGAHSTSAKANTPSLSDTVLQAAQPIAWGRLIMSLPPQKGQQPLVLTWIRRLILDVDWPSLHAVLWSNSHPSLSLLMVVHTTLLQTKRPTPCHGCVAVGSWSRINWSSHIPYNPEAAGLTKGKKILWKFVTMPSRSNTFQDWGWAL